MNFVSLFSFDVLMDYWQWIVWDFFVRFGISQDHNVRGWFLLNVLERRFFEVSFFLHLSWICFLSRFEFGLTVAKIAKFNQKLVIPVKTKDIVKGFIHHLVWQQWMCLLIDCFLCDLLNRHKTTSWSYS